MKKKIKISLILSLAIIFGCFSNVFAASNQNNKAKKMAEVKKSVRVLDSTNDNGVDDNTKLLMHMDDDNFKDECGHEVKSNGVTFDTTNKKFGNGSAYFNGSAYLSLDDSEDWNFESGDFTIDFWVKRGRINTNDYLFGQGNSNGDVSSEIPFFMFRDTNIARFAVYSGTKLYNIESKNKIEETTNWHHIACVRNNVNLYLFVDGQLWGSTTIGTESANNGSTRLRIGIDGEIPGQNFKGNIDEFRISKGIARWVPINNINLNKPTDSLILNDEIKGNDILTATVTPDNVANKTVKWTSSDEKIVYVDSVTGKITATGKGTAIITATTTDGTNLSAKCVVTVMEPVTPTPNPTDSSDKAILNITMTNGQVKQYNVTMDTVNKFISWYRLRSAGSGDPLYEFNITQTSNPNIIKTDYVVFDKISSFEVDDYTK